MPLVALVFLAVNLAAIGVVARGSRTLWLLPNLALLTFAVLYLLPIFTRPISDSIFLPILTANISLALAALLFRGLPVAARRHKPPIITGNVFLLLGVLFCSIGVFAVYQSLAASGGLTSVLLDYGGRGYLAARVNGANSGILGVLAWASPFGLAMLLAAWLQQPGRYGVFAVFLVFFGLVMGGYFLLTVRHNAVATLLMLAAVVFRYRGFKLRSALLFALPLVAVFTVFQAVRVAGVGQLGLGSIINSTSQSAEHLEVTEYMIEKTRFDGYTGFSQMLDLPVFLVPRVFWPEKPRTSTLNRLYFPEQASVGSEKSPGIVAEGYVSWGYPGIIIVSFAFMGLLSFVQARFDRLKDPLAAALFAAVFVPYTYMGVRTGVFGKHLVPVIFIYLEYLVAMRLARLGLRLRPRAGNIRPD